MRSLVRWLGRYLRHRQGIVEFCDDEDCIFRIRVAVAEDGVREAGVARGSKVLELHFWNEHLRTSRPARSSRASPR